MDKWVKSNKITSVTLIFIFLVCIIFIWVKNYINQSSTINLQSKCSSQAKKVFDEYTKGNAPDYFSYRNHYNLKLNKCYILISFIGNPGDGNESSNQYKLMDAFENKNIMSCSMMYNASAKLEMLCDYNGVTNWLNKDKFNTFIKQYMED